jgi:hypothetical protein
MTFPPAFDNQVRPFWFRPDRRLSLKKTRSILGMVKATSLMIGNDRPEVAVLLLKTALLLRDKPLEMMEEHPVEEEAHPHDPFMNSGGTIRTHIGAPV